MQKINIRQTAVQPLKLEVMRFRLYFLICCKQIDAGPSGRAV